MARRRRGLSQELMSDPAERARRGSSRRHGLRSTSEKTICMAGHGQALAVRWLIVGDRSAQRQYVQDWTRPRFIDRVGSTDQWAQE